MCKHVAAALYGVGARLDEKPELLFVLRGVDENDLLADAGGDFVRTGAAPATAKLLGDSDVAALFGLEMAESAAFDTHVSAAPKRQRGSRTSRGKTAPIVTKPSAVKKSKPRVAALKKSGRRASSDGTGKGGARRHRVPV
jgi:uncharacterized Zn finger protein